MVNFAQPLLATGAQQKCGKARNLAQQAAKIFSSRSEEGTPPAQTQISC
jgi:hypothetical protein